MTDVLPYLALIAVIFFNGYRNSSIQKGHMIPHTSEKFSISTGVQLGVSNEQGRMLHSRFQQTADGIGHIDISNIPNCIFSCVCTPATSSFPYIILPLRLCPSLCCLPVLWILGCSLAFTCDSLSVALMHSVLLLPTKRVLC